MSSRRRVEGDGFELKKFPAVGNRAAVSGCLFFFHYIGMTWKK
jgi:hypothetical protein